MKITLYMSMNKERERILQEALVSGFRHTDDQVEYCATSDYRGPREWSDLAVFVGVKSATIFEEHRVAKKLTMLIDKAYMDRADSHRFSLGGFQPFYLDDMQEPPQRMYQRGMRPHPRRNTVVITDKWHVVYAGSSQKYCNFHSLGDCNDYSVDACAKINEALKDRMELIYRPKPSWWNNGVKGKVIPPNTRFSGPNESFRHVLQKCHAVVTHGSNAAVEALAFGVPVVLLSGKGVSPVYSLAETDLSNILDPFWPTDVERTQVLANLAWCQFRLPEIASGFAWSNVKKYLKV